MHFSLILFTKQEVQKKFEQLTLDLESTSYVSNSLYTESWLRSFLSFIERNNDYLNVTIDTEEEFIRVLKEVSVHIEPIDIKVHGHFHSFIKRALNLIFGFHG